MMHQITCRVCGSGDTVLWRKGLRDDTYFSFKEIEYSLYSCRACRSLTLAPIPDLASLAEIYPADYSSYLRPKPRKSLLKKILTLPHDLRFGKRDRIPTLFGGGRLLDFGCGAGLQLAEGVSKGWKVGGVDYSVDALKHAKDNAPSAALWQGGLEALPADEMYDCITAFHVLEHLDDPLSWLQGVHRRLAPCGIVRIEIPIPCSVMQALFQGKYCAYDVPRHFSVPSLSGLQVLLRKARFEPLSHTPILSPTCLSESIEKSCQALSGVRISPGVRRINYLVSILPMAVFSALGMVCVISVDAKKV